MVVVACGSSKNLTTATTGRLRPRLCCIVAPERQGDLLSRGTWQPIDIRETYVLAVVVLLALVAVVVESTNGSKDTVEEEGGVRSN